MLDVEQALLDAPILIVDDLEPNVILLENLLRQRGYRNVFSTRDPFTVAPLHRAHHFALILLDLQMPGLDGLGVMAQLREDAREAFLPVLVITAQTDLELRLQALARGARDYISKPFVVAEVAQRIRNLLEVQLYYRERQQQAEILELRVRERTRQLEETQIEILRRLARAGEYRDNETGHHVIRVSQSSQALALEHGLEANAAEMILHASPMHDVGKIGIPDHILLRPGRLEGADLEQMRRHVEIGASILAGHDAPVMQMAYRIAMAHHERWDGQGYPLALVAEAIPVEARIVAVCDVFDALTSKRPYKSAWTVDDAVAYLRRESAGHFDPQLVECFLRILPQVLAIRERYQDET